MIYDTRIREYMETGDLDAARAYVAYHNDPRDGWFVYRTVIGENRIDFLKELLQEGASHKYSLTKDELVSIAAELGKPDVIRVLIEEGASVHGGGGMQALARAIDHGWTEAAMALIDLGADPNVPVSRKRTPLMLAFRRQQKGVVTRLLEAGADPMARDHWGRTVYDLARQWPKARAACLALLPPEPPAVPEE